MRVILLQDVSGTGKKGAVVDVAEGYARNYLLPRRFAKEASVGSLKALETAREAASAREQRLVEEARKTAEKIKNVMVTVPARAGEGGRLFGSITSQDIADALWKQHRVKIEKRRIEPEENIKTLGLHFAQVRLYHEISTEIRVHVVEEKKGESV
ncbi:MAG: 50S ribosomal protein L9 [Firmicutes bacterium]|nr:50S ribosomal protein L9 [Bacillota bacterium]